MPRIKRGVPMICKTFRLSQQEYNMLDDASKKTGLNHQEYLIASFKQTIKEGLKDVKAANKKRADSANRK